MNRSLKHIIAPAALGLALAACGSGDVTETSTESTVPLTDSASEQTETVPEATVTTGPAELPLTQIFVDEDGPSNLAEFVDASTAIVEARLVEVRPAVRFYGPDAEAPDAVTFEQVGLVFEPTTVHKGDVGEQVVVQWTAYTTEGSGPEARRLKRVSINGITVNEDSVGERFGLFVGQSVGDQLFESLTTAGIVPLNSAGQIQARHSASAFLYEDFVGEPFAEFIASGE